MTDLENQLIEKFKADFQQGTGRMVEVRLVDKWEELCFFDRGVPFWTLAQMVMDCTGWKAKFTFSRTRTEERILRRQVIDLIYISNGGTLTAAGKETGRDHTTVMHSIRRAKGEIETDLFYRKLVREIMEFIRANYALVYRDKTITKESCMADS